MRPSHLLVSAVVFLLGTSAWAEPPTSPSGIDPTVITRAPGGQGLYLRLGFGYGGYVETAAHEHADPTTAAVGWASVGELAAGAALRPGLILGGGLWTSSVAARETTLEGGVPAAVVRGSGSYRLVGPFLEWYPSPERGLHVEGGLGFATVDESFFGASSIGGGLMLGSGYDWPVFDRLRLGVLVRVTGVVAVQDRDADGLWFHAIGFSPSVLFTATYL